MARKRKSVKRRAVVRTAGTQSIIVAQPRSPARRRQATSIVRAPSRRRGGGMGGGKDLTPVAIAGGAMLGYLDGTGKLDALPEVMGSRMITLGLIGYAAKKYSKNAQIKAAGSAAMIVAAFDLGKGVGTTGALPKSTPIR